MLTYEVVGIPYDSGRGELAGPVLALRVLNWLQNKTGFVSDIEIGIDNMEVVNICGGNKINKMPLKACSRNIEMLLQLDDLKRKYSGILTVKYVKAHQDKKVPYQELSFEGKKNADCDVAVKAEVSRIRGGSDVVHEYKIETLAMLWP